MTARTEEGAPAPSNVLPFRRDRQGRDDQPEVAWTDQLAWSDARHIIAARREADNWMSVVLLGMLGAMDTEHLLRVELAIGAHAEDSEAAQQALALIRLHGMSKEHRANVKARLATLQKRGA